jgi:glycogen debranching enzyme
VSPPTLPGGSVVSHSGYTVVCSAADGQIATDPHGILDFDTRILSRHRLTVDGREPSLVSSGQPDGRTWWAVLQVERPGGDARSELLPQDALEVRVTRVVGRGVREEIVVTNHSAVPWQGDLLLELDADFADSAEVGRKRERRGTVDRRWDAEARALTLRHAAERDGRRFERAVRIGFEEAGGEHRPIEGGLLVRLDLRARASARFVLAIASLVDGEWRSPDETYDRMIAEQRGAWRANRPSLEAFAPLPAVFERAADDLFDLRNHELEAGLDAAHEGRSWFVNAGVPMFTGVFGRDSLTASWQAALLGPQLLRGALELVHRTQATEDDPWRDAEPGKMIHEMRRGPLAELGIDPRDRYYGTQTTPAMFVIALSEAWHWTGDIDLLWHHLPAAIAAMDWAGRLGDRDGDGFLEYETRSSGGLKNQGWKDSDEAIRYPDGSIVENPIATVEEQAFHFIALQRLAEILVALEMPDRAERFLRAAAALRSRWDEAFWMPDEAFYALALDAEKHPVRTITSNPGHALGAGIVPSDRARLVADRLLSPELFSGWGVRTLSDRHPSYNPFAYHLGSVWPVEQATFALGFRRYGLEDHLDRLLEAVFDAAARSPEGRLPEALSGHSRTTTSSPVAYPTANSPQAWSASAIIQLVQVMLGIYPFAPLETLALVRPRLPSWLPSLALRGLRIGRATVDLEFERRPDGSAAATSHVREGRLLVVPSGPPNDVEAGRHWLEDLERLALRRLPGHLVRAARIGIGLEV